MNKGGKRGKGGAPTPHGASFQKVTATNFCNMSMDEEVTLGMWTDCGSKIAHCGRRRICG